MSYTQHKYEGSEHKCHSTPDDHTAETQHLHLCLCKLYKYAVHVTLHFVGTNLALLNNNNNKTVTEPIDCTNEKTRVESMNKSTQQLYNRQFKKWMSGRMIGFWVGRSM